MATKMMDDMDNIKDHPRYRQRLALIFLTVFASPFCIVALADAYWDKSPWITQFVVLLVSAVFSFIDLFASRILKKKIPPAWILVFDVVFAITFLIIYIAIVGMARSIPRVYSNLAMLVACIIHTVCVVKEVHKHLKQTFSREVTYVCDRCGDRTKGKAPKWAARGGRDSDDEAEYLIYRDSTDADASLIAPDASESAQRQDKGKKRDVEAGA